MKNAQGTRVLDVREKRVRSAIQTVMHVQIHPSTNVSGLRIQSAAVTFPTFGARRSGGSFLRSGV
jgi:hypothetical protein